MRNHRARVGLIAAASLLLVVSGCAMVSTSQTPETVPKGKTRHTFGSGYVGVHAPSKREFKFLGTDIDDIPGLWAFVYSVRHGMTDRFELGARLAPALPGQYVGVEARATTKFQVVDDGWVLSLGAEPGVMLLGGALGGHETAGLEGELFALAGVRAGASTTIGLGPKLIGAYVASPSEGILLVGGVVNVNLTLAPGLVVAPELVVLVPYGASTTQLSGEAEATFNDAQVMHFGVAFHYGEG